MKILSVVLAGLILSGCGGESVNNPTNNTKHTKTIIVDQWDLSKTVTPKYRLSTEDSISDFSSIIYGSHPRLYFRDSDYKYLQNKMNTSEWKMLEATITKEAIFPLNLGEDDAIDRLNEFEEKEYPRLLIFYSYMKDDKKYKDIVIKWAVDKLSHEKIINNSSEDDSIRRRMARLSEVYDWLYSDLSKKEKETIRVALKKNIDVYMSWDYVKNPNFIQSHSRWGHGIVSKALLAMYGDFDNTFTKKYADESLSKIRELFRSYSETEKHIAEDGGWHLGWMYAFFYGDYTFNYMTWSSATSETMFDDWMGEMTYWYLYALRANNTLPQTGDANINGMYFGEYSALYQARYQKDGYAKWYLNKLSDTEYKYNNYFMKFLLSDSSVSETTPANLPSSRYFKNSGTVIARDRWDENTTMLIFKSSPFYSAGHHHRDENSFTIDYKIPLALDTGYYDRTDSPHYKNYYVRTIAHNAITVYNPNQKMYYYVHYNINDSLEQKELPNDGGQIYKEFDPKSKSDILNKSVLDGITKYNYNSDYTYMQGDATKAYDPITVTLAKRDIVYLKNSGYLHPVTIVLDRVESTNANFQKRYLLHMESDIKPSIDANKTTVISDDVKMTNITLYPTDANLKVVGSVDKSSSSAYPLYGQDIDTSPLDNEIVKNVNEDGTKTGNWRLEVSPELGKKYDLMLNAIFVGDKSMQSPSDLSLIDNDDTLGVILKDRVVVFSKEKNNKEIPLEYKLSKNGNFHHTIITNYKESDKVSISVNGLRVFIPIVRKSGCIDFSFTSRAQDVIRVEKIK